MASRALFVLAVGLVAACSSGPPATPIIIYVTPPPATSVASAPAPTQAPATAVPATSAAATAELTAAPASVAATPTSGSTGPPAPSLDASKLEPILLTWSDGGYVTAQVILPVVNTGDAWIHVSEFDSSFTIYNADGGIVETDSFDAAAPNRIAPAGESYLVGEVFEDAHPLSDYVRVEADGYYEEVDGPHAAVLTVENQDVRKGSLDSIEVVGEIHNSGTEAAENADVVAIFFNSAGDPIGFARGFAENIEAGGKRAFQIDSSFAEIPLTDIAETQVYASPWDF